MQKNRFRKMWRAFHADQSGQDMIEYALVAALVALAAITTMKTITTAIANFVNQSITKIAAIWP